MNQKTQVAEILRAAANKIREVGWTQGAAVRDGRMCALGSIGSVTGCQVTPTGIWDNDTAFLYAANALTRWLLANGIRRSVVGWNDAAGRTMDDVVTAMEKAAAWIEEQA